MKLIQDRDGTITDAVGNVLLFSRKRFEDEICRSGYCFVCGAKPDNTFNDEHVFSDWILKLCDYHNKYLTLPNQHKVRYSTYKIECCSKCNSQLSICYEVPMSRALKNGYSSLVSYIDSHGTSLLCEWLSLIFAKVHLKDFENPVSLDRRSKKGVIGDFHSLERLYWIHMIARSRCFGIEPSKGSYGSLHVIRHEKQIDEGDFDYYDSLEGRGIFLRLKDVIIIYVLDDCGQSSLLLENYLQKVPSTLITVQSRELTAHYLTANMHIIEPPSFQLEISKGDRLSIRPRPKPLKSHPYREEIFKQNFEDASQNLAINGLPISYYIRRADGKSCSFLTGSDGSFIFG